MTDICGKVSKEGRVCGRDPFHDGKHEADSVKFGEDKTLDKSEELPTGVK